MIQSEETVSIKIPAGVTEGVQLKVNGKEMNQQDFHFLQQIPQIIQQSGTVGEFKLGNLELSIKGMTDRRNDLIKS